MIYSNNALDAISSYPVFCSLLCLIEYCCMIIIQFNFNAICWYQNILRNSLNNVNKCVYFAKIFFKLSVNYNLLPYSLFHNKLLIMHNKVGLWQLSNPKLLLIFVEGYQLYFKNAPPYICVVHVNKLKPRYQYKERSTTMYAFFTFAMMTTLLLNLKSL